jgi:hypothetical protein
VSTAHTDESPMMLLPCSEVSSREGDDNLAGARRRVRRVIRGRRKLVTTHWGSLWNCRCEDPINGVWRCCRWGRRAVWPVLRIAWTAAQQDDDWSRKNWSHGGTSI